MVASCAFKCFIFLIIWDVWNLPKTYSFHCKVSAGVAVESKVTPMGWPQPPHRKDISMRWLFLLLSLQDSVWWEEDHPDQSAAGVPKQSLERAGGQAKQGVGDSSQSWATRLRPKPSAVSERGLSWGQLSLPHFSDPSQQHSQPESGAGWRERS